MRGGPTAGGRRRPLAVGAEHVPAGVDSMPRRSGSVRRAAPCSAWRSGSALRVTSVSGPVQLTTASASTGSASAGSELGAGAAHVDRGDAATDQHQPAVAAVAVDPGADLGRHPVPPDLPVPDVVVQEPAPLVEVEALPDRLRRRPQAIDDRPPVDAVGAGGRDLIAHERGEPVGRQRALGRR